MVHQQTLADYVLDQPAEQISASQSQEVVTHANPTYPAGRTNTSTFRYTLNEQTRAARSGSMYNPNVNPYQHPLLRRYGGIDTSNSQTREDLYFSSNLIRKHTRDALWELDAKGWDYAKPGQQLETDPMTGKAIGNIFPELDWPPELRNKVIDAFGRAMTIDTAFVVRWENGTFETFTRNDQYGVVYLTPDYRRISEIYFRYDPPSEAVAEKTGGALSKVIAGFLTQYSDDEFRPNKYPISSDDDKDEPRVYKDCVMFQPISSPRDIWGIPYLKVEVETGTQKIVLRSLEFIYMHNMGIMPTIVFPKDGNKTALKNRVITHIKNGVWSRGLAMDVKMSKGIPVGDMVLIDKQVIPALPFDQINSMVSEDAQLTKQSVEGEAASGALGGAAPDVNFEMDAIQKDSLMIIFEQAIRDINEVFYDVPAYKEEEMTVQGRTYIKRVPAYEIVWRQPVVEMMDDQTQEDTNSNNSDTKNKNQTNQRAPAGRTAGSPQKAASTSSAQKNAVSCGPESSVAICHSVSAEGYVVYEGNVFQAGTYYYPERQDPKTQFETYSEDDIKHFTQNPVNRQPIEFNPQEGHSDSVTNVGLGDNIGYSETIGYNADLRADRTRFYIKKDQDKKLREDGVITNDTFLVSPRFHRRVNADGKKSIMHQNTALLDPRRHKPRAQYTGLQTSASKVN